MIGGIREFPHDLVERVESGVGGDRELDYAAGLASGHWTVSHTLDDGTRIVEYMHPVYKTVWSGSIGACIPHLTASLDAVVSLIEQKLQGWGHCYATGWDAEGNCGGFVSPERTVDLTKAIMGQSKSPARALLAATLRAIQAQARTLADAHSKNPQEAEHEA